MGTDDGDEDGEITVPLNDRLTEPMLGGGGGGGGIILGRLATNSSSMAPPRRPQQPRLRLRLRLRPRVYRRLGIWIRFELKQIQTTTTKRTVEDG